MKILDACCGSRMFWFDKANKDVTYMDNRTLDTTLCDGRKLVIAPDIVADFTNIPFENESFNVVVFDPPHLLKAGTGSWLALKYGVLSNDWQEDIKQGFSECIRVLKPNGIICFKWSEDQIKTADVLKLLLPYKPLFGDKRSKTRWLFFVKGVMK